MVRLTYGKRDKADKKQGQGDVPRRKPVIAEQIITFKVLVKLSDCFFLLAFLKMLRDGNVPFALPVQRYPAV